MVIAKKLRPGRNPIQFPLGLDSLKKMVRKGGFEPPRLSAPPPQDGVSASSTTSALKSISCRPLEEYLACMPHAESLLQQPHAESLLQQQGCRHRASLVYTRSSEAVQVQSRPANHDSWPRT